MEGLRDGVEVCFEAECEAWLIFLFDEEEDTTLLFPNKYRVVLMEVQASTTVFWKFSEIVPWFGQDDDKEDVLSELLYDCCELNELKYGVHSRTSASVDTETSQPSYVPADAIHDNARIWREQL